METSRITSRALVIVRSTRIGRLLSVRRSAGRAQRLVGRALQRIVARFPWLLGVLRTAGRQRQTVDVDHLAKVTDVAAPSEPPETLISHLDESADWRERRRAAAALGHAGGEAVTRALLHALRDPSAEVAVAAISSLAARRAPEATDALREIVANRDGYHASVTRAAAVTALVGADDGPETRAALSDAVFDVDAEVSLSAIAALAEHGGATAGPLLSVLRDQSGFFLPIVRLAAAQGLKRAGSLSATLCTELLSSESDPAIVEVLQQQNDVN